MSAVPESRSLDLEQAVEQYDIGRLVSHDPVSASGTNRSYFLRTRREDAELDFMLTFVDPPTLPTSSYVTLLDKCAEAGLPVARMLRTRKNLPYATTSTMPAFIAPRLRGRIVYNPTQQQLRSVGRFAARFHIAAAPVEYLMPDFPKTVSWLRGQEQSLRGLVSYAVADLIVEATRRVRSLLERRDVSDLPNGVIHTALDRNNVLFNERGLTGVLNLDNAAQGHLVYDLAVIANDWCNDSAGSLDPERTLWLLKGYQEVRPLTRQEIWFLPGFALYAALNAWVTRLASANGRRFDNPNELERTVRQHLGHAFYLDERLLC